MRVPLYYSRLLRLSVALWHMLMWLLKPDSPIPSHNLRSHSSSVDGNAVGPTALKNLLELHY